MAMHLVSKENLKAVTEDLATRDILIWDVETTGLNPYHDAKMFSLALGDLEGQTWYFNFKSYRGLGEEFVLTFDDVKPIMDYPRKWVAHNAKFDLHFTDRAGIKPNGQVFDTEVMARLFENHHHYTRGGYSLDSCAKRWLEVRKDDRVKAWMDENGAYDMQPGPSGSLHKHYYFDLVPFEIISEYACLDAKVTAELYLFLLKNMYENKGLVELESRLSTTLFEIERNGILIDREYCTKAHAYETKRACQADEICRKLAGAEFTDSAKFLAPLLAARGFNLPETEKGNPQITDEALSQIEGDELAKAVLDLREASKRAQTYWANYLLLADAKDTIHPNFRQSGTTTGRMSCNSPNLQNIPGEDLGEFPVRRAFIPRPGFIFVSIDYKAMELRLALFYAQETALLEKIYQGHDPHQATADLTGLSRQAAKTLNFMVLFGAGIRKIAEALGVSEAEAKQFKYRYFDALPGLQGFIYKSKRRMEARGYSFDWAGRRFILDDPRFAYKSCNAIIQGGSSTICKSAMVALGDRLRPLESRMVLQVHDELVLEVHLSEIDVVRDAVLIMREAFPHPVMDCSISWGRNLHDLVEVESVEEIRP